MRKRPLFYIACVFLTGLAYARYHISLLAGVFLVLLLWEIWCSVRQKQLIVTAGRSVILLSAFLLGAGHMHLEENFRDAYMSKMEDGSRITVWGEIIKTESTEVGYRAILSDCYISLSEEVLPCNDIMVYASSDHFQVGEIHKITGQVQMFDKARNQGNFDSRVFYQSQKIDFSLYEETSTRLQENTNSWKKSLVSIKEKMTNVYENSMEGKAAGFFAAMVLGDKTELDKDLKELFTIAGISHILAISGLHVSIIGRGFYKLLRKRRISFLIAGIFASILLLSYCNMVGNGMSAVRAVGMMLFYFLAQYWGRSYDMPNSLGAMVLLLLWENPFLIEYSGFWFSVMALIGVGFVGKTLSDSVSKGKSIGMSVGITLTTLPIVASCYYEIPLYSPLVNAIVLPILTPVFCLAVIGGIVGIFVPFLAQILLFPCQWALIFYEWLCSMVEKLPGASIICGMPAIATIVVYYVVLFVGTYMQRNLRKYVLMVVLCLFCGIFICFPKEKPFEITFLDVGQGDGIYISTGDGTTYFVDGGSTSVNEVGTYRILPFLKSKGVTEIDYWFVTHADTDHISGVMEIMESGYEIGHLVVSDDAPKDENLEMLFALAKSMEVDVIRMRAGEKIVSENSSMLCLAPDEMETEDRNDASLVLQFVMEENTAAGNFSALFTGDISLEVEQKLVESGGVQEVVLYKASHHGSNYSNGEELLQTISPEIIVVSCGENNIYGHPGKKAVERMELTGAEIYYTMDAGQVTIRYEEAKKGLVIEGYLLLQ